MSTAFPFWKFASEACKWNENLKLELRKDYPLENMCQPPALALDSCTLRASTGRVSVKYLLEQTHVANVYGATF